MLAVTRHRWGGSPLRYVRKQSEALCLAAARHSEEALPYIRDSAMAARVRDALAREKNDASPEDKADGRPEA